LPFTPRPSASIAGRALQESTYTQRHSASAAREFAEHRDRSTDDARPGLTTIFSGEVRTATIARTAKRASATSVSTPRRCVRCCAHPTNGGPVRGLADGTVQECFYAFRAGEVSRYEPHPVRNTTVMAPSKTSKRVTTCQKIWPTTRSTGSVAQSTASLSAVLHVLGQRLPARAALHQEGMGRPLHGKLDDGWDATATRFTSSPSRRAESTGP
jgi:hypothetical protein